MVAPRTVVAAIAKEQVVGVGKRIVTRTVVRKTERLGPRVLAVVRAVAPADLVVAGVLVDIAGWRIRHDRQARQNPRHKGDHDCPAWANHVPSMRDLPFGLLHCPPKAV